MHGQVYFYEKVILVLSLLCMDKFISMKWLFYFYEMAILALSLLCMDKFISMKRLSWYYHCYAWTSLFL